MKIKHLCRFPAWSNAHSGAAAPQFWACQGQLAPAFVIEHDIMKAQGCNYWRELCIAAAFEDNPERLPEIVAEINSQLPERQEDLVTRAFESLATGFPPPQGKHWIQ